ncbi:hypothetical protein J2X31_003564 [Flavobacterium arsenatis]|uniref:Signal transduction histidine kinase internal region domain-containing protein n=1 Tax=Flavobacterium arsenatis TaxID=1484332 RepID=A0ABU1TUL2_9FLAO|nr:histidine kinase [Flavobacterium arsenatis]MDR6969531.1 hypothetical protein [Flavobacterium arsenatis]
MKHTYLFLAIVALVFATSCNQKKTINQSDIERFKTEFDTLANIRVTDQNTDSVKTAWTQYLKNPQIAADTLLAAKANYFLARYYGMRQNDSTTLFIEKALELIEPTAENWADKARIYSGMGNVWNSKSKEHQANYYYNKAATIILADSTIDLKPVAKSIMLLSAAQSNKHLYQFELSQQMNKAALALTPQLPPTHINQQRPLTQIIQTMKALDESPENMKPYLQQLEDLQKAFPEHFDISFLYDSKSIYYQRTEQFDSILHYELLKNKIYIDTYQYNPKEQAFINNLFISYINIGINYVRQKNQKVASSYFEKANELLQTHQDLISTEALILYKKNLAGLYELEGKNKQAIKLLFETNELQKSNFETKNTQAVAEMNTLYQLQAKDRSIQNLNENIKIKALQLEQNKLWLIITTLAIVLLGILLFFIYKTYKHRRVLQEREQVLLQQQLLRTQMEPHFIFNTLSALQSFIRLDKKEEAITYLNKFSRLLRSSLELSREKTVPLGQELEALENYLNLQQMRFENAFTYQINLPEEQDMEALMLPPMLIQPFVENAILHGIDLNSKDGFVHIDFTIQNEMLEIKIKDSGRQNPQQKPLAHRSLSGIISKERISHLGKEANVAVTALENGTEVIIQVPVVY